MVSPLTELTTFQVERGLAGTNRYPDPVLAGVKPDSPLVITPSAGVPAPANGSGRAERVVRPHGRSPLRSR
jgi:hypothetical protein